MQIFVGNLSFKAQEADIKKLFEEFGVVSIARVILDKRRRKSRGFGFIDMPNDTEAQTAINALNNKEFMGRTLNISQSHPKPEQSKDESSAPSKTTDYPNKNTEFKPYLKRTGRYKEGRRSISYIKRRTEAGIEETPKSSWRNKNKENPMRWRKKTEYKPWKRVENRETKPWHKSENESRPYHRSSGESKPWHKPSGDRPQRPGFKGQRKPYANKNRPSKSRYI